MKKFSKNSIVIVVVAISVILGFNRPITTQAATSPDLGTAATYSILAGSAVTNTGATTISGNVGISPGIGGTPHYTGFDTVTLGGVIHDADGAAATAQGDKNTAYTALASQSCDTTYIGAFKELAGEIITPGVYCADSFHLTSGTLTLSGNASDVWIFKSSSDLIISGGAAAKVVFTGSGTPCNVWWRVVSSATFDADSSLIGNILSDTSITFAAGASLNGRALARTAAVTMDGNVISTPTCTATPSGGGPRFGSINVIKLVINDSGGKKTVADFPLFVDGTPVISGVTNNFIVPAATFTVTEISDSHYARSFSGDCDVNGKLNLNPGDSKICIITNNDIGVPVVVPVPPLIDVVKVPSPLALPAGPGSVTYTYTLRNIGTVPVTNVTMVDDTCSPTNLISGDTNNDAKLDVNETWIYSCSTTLSATHTNTVVATGWANGISATDIANATVVVGLPIVPPLIHITKTPNPLTLPAGPGLVTYTKKVTNPGTVALSNVTVTDNKCGPINYISGDVNNDAKLDPSETWTYTCKTKLTQTTTNTAIATGTANGLTARDFAIATVVVGAPSTTPKLPKTGLPLEENKTPWNIIVLSSIFVLGLTSFIVLKKRMI
jgi:type VI secretion system secreted protein VgrG